MLINLLVAPVKNPPVATNTTKPRSLATFLSLISISFWFQLGYYCHQWLSQGLPWVSQGVPWVIYGSPWVSQGTPWGNYSTPWVSQGMPWVTYSTPWVTYGSPWQTHGSPWESHSSAYLSYYILLGNKQVILLNNSSLFYTLNA